MKRATLCLLVLAGTLRAGDELDATAMATAAEEAGELVKQARKAPAKDRDARRAVKAAYLLLEPFASDVRRRIEGETGHTKAVIAFATLFNELLTVAAMYGKGFREPYICWRRTVARKRLRIELPVSPHWKLTYVRKSQHVGTITQTRPNGKPLRTIKIWRYKWNTVYSGVGGENCRKLAEVIHELDRDEVKASGGKVSSRVRVKKLNRHFKRVYHYRLETYDSELEDIVRRREFYFKGTSATFNFEVTEHCGWKDDDDALTRFRIDNEGVELMHVLQSLEPNDD